MTANLGLLSKIFLLGIFVLLSRLIGDFAMSSTVLLYNRCLNPNGAGR